MGPYREGHGEAPKQRWFVIRMWIRAREALVGLAAFVPGVLLLGVGFALPWVGIYSCRESLSAHQEQCARVCNGNAAAYLDDAVGYNGPASCTCLRDSEIIRFDGQWQRQEPELGELSPTVEPTPTVIAPAP